MKMRSGPVPSPVTGPGFCTSSGGADSLAAVTDDLRLAADLLDRSGDVAAHTLLALGLAAADLPITGAIASPGSAADIAGQVAAATLGADGLGVLCLRTEALARLLRLAATVYDDTEWLQRMTFAAEQQLLVPPRLAFEAAGTSVNSIARALGADRDLVPGTEGFWSDAVTAIRMNLFGFAMPGVGLDGQIGVLAAGGMGLGWFADSTVLQVRQVGPAQPGGAGPRDLGDLADEVAAAYDKSPDHEQLLIRRVTQADGSSAWVVSIPGTAQWWPRSSADPADLGGNLLIMAGLPSSLYPAVATCLTSAMRQAGVAPGTEPVMLVGHSQGGIVAARMAQDRDFSERFDVTEVVTFASPVTGMDLPDGINGLDISNQGDGVPRLDQQDSANAANRSQINCGEPDDPAVSLDFGQHDIGRYAERSRQMLGTGTAVPAARDFYRRADGLFLGGRSTTYTFTMHRPVGG